MIEFINVTKKFGSVIANDNINFKIDTGSIHAIIGENGAGKSTIVKILFGLYQADAGEIQIDGKRASFDSPIHAKEHGIGMVHQHFMLAGPITALDHVLIEQKQRLSFIQNIFSPLPRKKLLTELQELSNKYKMPVPWDKKIDDLSVGVQQRIEILKLLHNQSEILILDEPTAVLTPQEIEAFFERLKEFKQQGKTIIIITHKLKEVMAIADKATVFRSGKHIGTYPIQDVNVEKLGELMVGEKLQIAHSDKTQEFTKSSSAPVQLKKFSVSVDNKALLKNINLQIQSGEILGIAGVEGNGQTELLNAITRPQMYKNKTQGGLEFQGQSLIGKHSLDIRKMGISFFPEDRLKQGVLPTASALENFLLGQQHRKRYLKNFGVIQWKSAEADLEQAFQQFDVRPRNANLSFNSYSGGNQQKLVVAREILEKPKFLIAAQPTRGVDIGAMQIIHREILKLKQQGSSILLVSSDLEELLKLSDRILVIYQGKIVSEFTHQQFDEKKIGAYMGGGKA